MKENTKNKKAEEKIVLDGDFNDKFERMLHQARKEKAEEARKKKQK